MEQLLYSTQEHLDILDVADGLVLLKTGGGALILQTNAVNFDLLSEREQDVMISAYGALLNSLTFPIQVVIRSKRLDISAYTERLGEFLSTQPNPKVRERISSYRDFINSLVQKGEVLDKRFYLIIPYYEAPSLPTSSLFDKILGRKPKSPILDKHALLERAKTNLAPKKEHLMKLMERLGIKTWQLTTKELVELFYDTYNPAQAGLQHLEGEVSQYTATLVEPAVAKEPPPPSPSEAPHPESPEEKGAANGSSPKESPALPKEEPKPVIPKGPLSNLTMERTIQEKVEGKVTPPEEPTDKFEEASPVPEG